MRFSESGDALSLDLVLVPSDKRGQGTGHLLLRRLLLLADSLGKPVLTTARPIGKSTPETLDRLERFYGRSGFRVVQRGVSSALMRRDPPSR
jgi:GNAT superfamily N-acetyltransferase